MKRFVLNRRAVLRGLMGGAVVGVGLPTLEAMLDSHGTAFADGSPIPVRFLTWFWGNGVILNRWIPGGVIDPVVGANYPLSPQLEPLANVKEYVSVVSGFQNKCSITITHHEGMTAFSGYDFDMTCHQGQDCSGIFSNAGGPTIDQVVASRIGRLTSVPSIQLGVSKRQSGADFGTTMHNLSHKSTLEPLPPLRNPKDVFYSLFGSFTPPEDPSKPTRIGVLQAVRSNLAELEKKLGAKDKQRLEAHVEGISELEGKINALPPACELPDEPTETNADDPDGNERLAAVNQVMSDLLVYAFTCDVTRTASTLYHEGASDTFFPGISGGAGHHNNSHGFYTEVSGGKYHEQDLGGLEQTHGGIVFCMGQLAYLLEQLKAAEDGPGKNLLDNSVIYVSSDCAEGWSHDVRKDQPVLLVGGGGGQLVHPGIHLRSNSLRNLTDIALTAVRVVAPEVRSIGGGDPYSDTIVTELMKA